VVEYPGRKSGPGGGKRFTMEKKKKLPLLRRAEERSEGKLKLHHLPASNQMPFEGGGFQAGRETAQKKRWRTGKKMLEKKKMVWDRKHRSTLTKYVSNV